MPAAWTRTSTDSSPSTTRAATASSPQSPATNVASSPSASALSGPSRRALSTSVKPRERSSRAQAAPMPPLAPMTTAVLAIGGQPLDELVLAHLVRRGARERVGDLDPGRDLLRRYPLLAQESAQLVVIRHVAVACHDDRADLLAEPPIGQRHDGDLGDRG